MLELFTVIRVLQNFVLVESVDNYKKNHFKKPMHFLLFGSGRGRFPYFRAGQLIVLLKELFDSHHWAWDVLLLLKCSVNFGQLVKCDH